jgi:tetratricopeptide (TPR) repeat protein
MRKSLLTMLIALTAIALAVPVPAAAQAAPAPKKEIKDPAEYNSYVGATQQTDPQAKISGLIDFLQRYPNSVVKEDALEHLMTAYQQTGDAAKALETVGRLLEVSPNNLRGLAVMAYNKRQAALAGQDTAKNAADAEDMGQRGLKTLSTAAKPEGMSDADWDKLKRQYGLVFNAAIGFGELQKKNWPEAAKYLQQTVQADPTQFYDVYYLGVAYLQQNPINPLGLFYVARAVNLSSSNADVVKFGKYYYGKYHGSMDGWDALVTRAKDTLLPPEGFTIAPAPTLADQARALVDSKDPKQMSFAEWELVLGAGEPPVADKVWSAIKGQSVEFAGRLISATRTTLLIAATVDAIEQKQPDVEVTMSAPLPLRLVPRAGAEIQILAVPTSYAPKPFVMKMNKGVLRQAAPKRNGRG